MVGAPCFNSLCGKCEKWHFFKMKMVKMAGALQKGVNEVTDMLSTKLNLMEDKIGLYYLDSFYHLQESLLCV